MTIQTSDLYLTVTCNITVPLNRKKERKIEKWLFFKHLVLTCTIVLMNDLGLDDTEFAGDSDFHI
jgi:hypothetical protein